MKNLSASRFLLFLLSFLLIPYSVILLNLPAPTSSASVTVSHMAGPHPATEADATLPPLMCSADKKTK
jgi:hypothetical protein